MPINLNKITFNAGSTPSIGNSLTIDVGSVTILVGPNNSGKSLALREIEDRCLGKTPTPRVIFDLDIEVPTDPLETLDLLRTFQTEPPEGQIDTQGSFWVGLHTFRKGAQKFQIHEQNMINATSATNFQQLLPNLVALYTARLDGKTRFALSNNQPTGDLKGTPENHLWALFQNDDAREKVRKLTEDAFDLHFTIDPTNMTNFSIQLSERKPVDKLEEQALDARSRQFHSSAEHISEFSDGVQAFVGLISAVLSLEHRIMLIDEPEAFLHPTLAYLLGSNMSEIAEERKASLIVSTHSPSFLMASISKSASISVVRLTYNNRVATARELSSTELKLMMQDPLLRSTKTLEALFHNAVVVTESDSDRSFYDEINNRLIDENRGIGQCLFLNGQNKQTIHRIIEPLRKIGVPAAGIADLDILNVGDTDWNNLMSAINSLNDPDILSIDRSLIVNEFDSLSSGSQKAIKKIGIPGLSTTKNDAEILLKKLEEYGLFLVPTGEIETWLPILGATGHGTDWLIRMFTSLGSEPTDTNYVKPSSDDVWNFIDRIGKWANNPNRKGIPN